MRNQIRLPADGSLSIYAVEPLFSLASPVLEALTIDVELHADLRIAIFQIICLRGGTEFRDWEDVCELWEIFCRVYAFLNKEPLPS